MRDDIQVAVLDGLGRPNPWLRQWLKDWETLPDTSPVWYTSDFLDRADRIPSPAQRNAIAARFLGELTFALGPEGRPWLVMLDDDIVPDERIAYLLNSAAPVAGARYMDRHGSEAHAGDNGVVGLGACKIHATVLRDVGPNAFRHEGHAAGADRCECAVFCEAARACGYYPVKAGAVGHLLPVIVTIEDGNGLPAPAGGQAGGAYRVTFPPRTAPDNEDKPTEGKAGA